MKSWFSLLTFLLIGTVVHASNYYISPSGNDNNNGTSPSTPWKTIVKINNHTFLPGDAILFQKGGVWRETLFVSSSGSASKPITFSSYGTGVKPILNGANIYKGSWVATNTPGIWTMNSPIANNVTPTLMMDGAILNRVMSITAVGNKTFYIDKKSNPDKIFLYSGSNPNNRIVEISTREYGIYISRKSYIHISQLTIINCLHAGIRFDGNGLYDGKPKTYYNGYSVADHVTVGNSVKYGIVTGNGYSYATIKQCSAYSNGNGFYADGNGDHTLFQNDTAYHNYSQTDPFTDGNGFGIYKSSFNIVENCLAYENKTGTGIEIDLNNTDSSLIVRYNKVYGNGTGSEGYGIKTGNLAGLPVSNLIYYNLSYLNGNDPIDKMGREFYHQFGNISFYNNTAYTTGTSAAYAITLAGSGTVILKNNIFYAYGGSNRRCIRRINTPVLLSDNNLYFSTAGTSFINGSTPCDFTGWQKFGYDKMHSQHANALFTADGSNFTLLALSPAINNGTPVGLTKDILGNPITGLPDLGAFEKTSIITPPNQAPVANAGQDVSITLPLNTVTLKGNGTDKDGSILSYLWKQVSGPAVASLSSTTTSSITVSKLENGIYKFTLTVKDNNNATGMDSVTLKVNTAANQPPSASTGPNQTIILPTSSITLNGSASSDPDGKIVSYSWQQISGPAISTLSSVSTATVTASKLIEGVYSFRLTVKDNNSAAATAMVSITVKKKPNKNPVANAGMNRTITLPTQSSTLSGVASTDPDGTITSYLWQQISGPSSAIFSSVSGMTTTVSSLKAGVYSFRLTVWDNGSAVGTANVSITVNKAANKPPVAFAGNDQTLLITKNYTTLDAGGSTDTDGIIISYTWQQENGPAKTVFSSTTAKTIQVSNLQAGEYTFRLTVKDNEAASANRTVKINVIDNFIKAKEALALYPNPASGIIHVRVLNSIPGKMQISVLDITGKEVTPTVIADKPAAPYSIQVDITGLARGTYVIRVFSIGQKEMSATFLKI
ncbi:MAG: PKD domain-containing protein [Chitinophagaceae bacterium]